MSFFATVSTTLYVWSFNTLGFTSSPRSHLFKSNAASISEERSAFGKSCLFASTSHVVFYPSALPISHTMSWSFTAMCSISTFTCSIRSRSAASTTNTTAYWKQQQTAGYVCSRVVMSPHRTERFLSAHVLFIIHFAIAVPINPKRASSLSRSLC